MKLATLIASSIAFWASTAVAADTYSAKVLVDRATSLCTLIKPTERTQLHRAIKTEDDILERFTLRQNRLPEELLLQEPADMQQFIEILGGSASAVDKQLAKRCPHGVRANPDALTPAKPSFLRGANEAASIMAAPVTRKLVDSGDPSNRIDVVFMGDGYTAAEQDKFFSDMQRLTNDMFTGDTFAQYLPLFNIWAAYVPSVESGIGVGGTPKNTAFKLYRDGTELRAVYTGNAQAARTVCNQVGTNACDFPSLIGNDAFYGGLGGEFVISTSSPTSGTIVLRHEMGHNFGNVGEEYDGGYVYSGANAVKSLTGVTWKHWLTEPTKLVEQKSVQLYQKHIWYDLAQGAYTITFKSTGTYKRWYILLSVSGTDTQDSLTVTLDGKPLPWTTKGVKDRSFYDWRSSTAGFSAGTHTLTIKAGGGFGGPIIKQLCNAVIYEYMDETQFKMDDPNYIGLYPTYDINKAKSYRPDNELCLMRNMSSPTFCRVCQENMWLKFMARIEFIDTVAVTGKVAEVKVIPLGQKRLATDSFVTRNPTVANAEKYSVAWFRGTTELVKYRDQFVADFTGEPTGTNYKVRVTFSTPNVRKDTNKYMMSEKTFTIV